MPVHPSRSPKMIGTTTHLSLLVRLAVAVFVFFFPLQKSAGVDPYFKNCSVIRTCGGLNISFPFYIKELNQRYCGNPGFQVSCIHNTTVLQIEDSRYIVHQIFYRNMTLRVSNDIGSECLSLFHESPFPTERFILAQPIATGHFSFLYDCRTSLPDNLTRYKINCSGENGASPVLAMAKRDPNWVLASGKCRGVTEVPVEDGGNEIGEELVRRGFMLRWIASDCSVCDNSGGKCGFNFSDFHFQCFCSDRPHADSCPPRSRSSILKLVLGFSGAGIVILIAVALYIKITKTDRFVIFWKKPTGNYPNVEAFLRNHESLAPKRYRYSDVKKMTNSFKDKLGEGGYGGVYKGKLPEGHLVAVKVLSEMKGNGEEFINEVASIGRTSHVNVVTLLGFCYEGRKRALIYEFMANGSLEKFIYLRNPSENGRLGWETLYDIAVGIARGLEYLHRGCNTRIVHFDIKPHNILLAEDFCPKISDFGLAKLCTKKESMISMFDARGTPGYIAPEVFSRSFGDVSHKSDVYSYGVMVSEMIGGRKIIEVGVDNISEIYFPHWIHSRLELEELGLQGLMSDEDRVTARKMIIVSLWCIQTKPSDRPSMRRVLDMLEGSLQSLTIPPKPFLFSPTRSTQDSTTTLEPPTLSAATHI